jgi:hypothetical protein
VVRLCYKKCYCGYWFCLVVVVLLLLSWGFVGYIVVFSLVPSCVVAAVAFSLLLSYAVAVTMVCEGVWLLVVVASWFCHV